MLNAIAASFRTRYRESLEKRTASLDPQTRADLARDIHSTTLLGVDELQEVNASIEQAQISLRDLDEKKRFIGLRLVAYKKKLELTAKRLQRDQERLTGFGDVVGESESTAKPVEETNPLHDGRAPGMVTSIDDIEEQNDDDASEMHNNSETCHSIEELQMKQAQLQREQVALAKVEKSHRDMESNARELQKRIFVLERKREEMLKKTGECRDFLVAAAHVEQERESEEDDGTVHSEEDLEEGMSADSGPPGEELIVLLNEGRDESAHAHQPRREEQKEDNKSK